MSRVALRVSSPISPSPHTHPHLAICSVHAAPARPAHGTSGALPCVCMPPATLTVRLPQLSLSCTSAAARDEVLEVVRRERSIATAVREENAEERLGERELLVWREVRGRAERGSGEVRPIRRECADDRECLRCCQVGRSRRLERADLIESADDQRSGEGHRVHQTRGGALGDAVELLEGAVAAHQLVRERLEVRAPRRQNRVS
mmetsp:Transcript_2103/g.5923  ORF Transcript_2103/g.5923 Transcript_2103/m.5923 type:complete len:204 (+) Transcript_2103:157-768(+)|eukprot:CAMPEP_0115867004 /NCGR_PEP_ID=MMETSP0287-20121206/20544_1 /TAXON_ID=412157 /ORGANISM="Chrysochromulina rotalis, Strain UIO044" /LENGTH=203 /DNA_ID=CAMNT_0003321595 /DNA_START=101 /DNA_END=712 /DNA_ORIENTATION=+